MKRSLLLTITSNRNLVPNGTFDANTEGWSVARGALSVVSGAMRVTATAAYANAFTNIATVTGRRYTASVQLVGVSVAKSVGFYIGTNDYTADLAYTVMGSTPGVFTLSFVATGPTSCLFFQDVGDFVSGDYFDIDNISVRRG